MNAPTLRVSHVMLLSANVVKCTVTQNINCKKSNICLCYVNDMEWRCLLKIFIEITAWENRKSCIERIGDIISELLGGKNCVTFK